jgi:hypothetical protein
MSFRHQQPLILPKGVSVTSEMHKYLQRLIGTAEISRALADGIFELLRLREAVRRAEAAAAGERHGIKRKTRPGRLFMQPNGDSQWQRVLSNQP